MKHPVLWKNLYLLYIFRSEEEGDDEVDSDFSIEENDEPKSDNDEEGNGKRQRRINTKAYKVKPI